LASGSSAGTQNGLEKGGVTWRQFIARQAVSGNFQKH